MAYFKWQTVAKWGTPATVSLGLLLFGIFNLAGMEVSHDGDKDCVDCFSEIRVNSSFWEIRVEHAGDEPVLFKKRTRSRTLWLNLDKIDELVTTDPKVKTEILVGAISRTADLYNEEYGHLRHLKDGDTLIGRGRTNRIILHGINVSTIVKWTFEMDHWLSEGISIDPVWRGVNITKICDWRFETNRTFGMVEHSYNCRTGLLNQTESLSYAHCYNSTFNANGSRGAIFEHTYTRIRGNTIFWEERETIKNTTTRVCELKGYQVNNRKINFVEQGYNCKLRGVTLICDSKQDGNADGTDRSGESHEAINLLTMEKKSRLDFIRGIKIE